MSQIPVIRWPAKQPYDITPYQINLRPWMARGQVINWIGARIYEKGVDPEVEWDDAMLKAVAFSDHIAQVKVQEGVSGLTYRVRIRVTTVDGSRYEVEGEFKVVEVT